MKNKSTWIKKTKPDGKNTNYNQMNYFDFNYRLQKLFTFTFIFLGLSSSAQVQLSSDLMEPYAFRFSIDEENKLSEEAMELWRELIGANQYVGFAEVHNSIQKNVFSSAILDILHEKEFAHIALEIGPNSATILNEYAYSKYAEAGIKWLNRVYGRRKKTPIPFVNTVSDIQFITRVFELNYTIWGLDQEYLYAPLMLFDRLFKLHANVENKPCGCCEEAKKLIKRNRFRRKVKRQFLACWYQSNPVVQDCLEKLSSTPEANKIVADLRASWEIYCKSASGTGSNQQRANYMKQNFEIFCQSSNKLNPKVFFKFGSVHLTRGISPYGVDDLGKHLKERAEQNKTGYLSIRQMVPFRNGKSLIAKPSWKSVSTFLELGTKDLWTVIDLRPLREELLKGNCLTTETNAYEIMSYDLILLPPDDQFLE